MKDQSIVGFVVILAATIVSAIRCMFFQHKFYKYLRQEHTEKWKELTTVFGFGPGFANSIRGLRFLFSKEDMDDPEFLRLKVTFRNSLIYVLTGVVATFIMFFITAYAYTKH